MANLIPDVLQKPIHVGPVTLPNLLPDPDNLHGSVVPHLDAQDRMASMVLSDAGWPKALIPTALGIIQAESTRNASAVNGTPCSKAGDHAVGWFQVCTVNCGAGGTSSDKSKCTEQLKNPAINSKTAYAVYRSQGWGAWTTYHPGIKGSDFKVDAGSLGGGALGAAIDNPVGNAVASATGGLDGVLGFLSTPDSWFRIGKVALGFVAIALCLAVFLFKLGVAPPPVKAVRKVVG